MAFKEKLTNEEFIRRSIEVHGDIFDYSKTEYKNQKTPVIIICKKHGEFKKLPISHINQKQGCPYCTAERLGRTYKPQEPKEKKLDDPEVIDSITDNVAKECAEEIKKIVTEVPINYEYHRKITQRKIQEYLLKRMIKFFPNYRHNGQVYDFFLNDKNLLINIGGSRNILNVEDFESFKRIF
jgi:rRNA maturation protein Rpf1